MRKLFCLLTLFFVLANTSYAAMQCGSFTLKVGSDGWSRINGEKPSSQKVTYLGKKGDNKNMRIQWVLESKDGNMYGMEYMSRPDKVWLNVQLLQNSINATKIIGSFPCKNISD